MKLGLLTISNGKFDKPTVKKNGVGLANLSERYELLVNQRPTIENMNEVFVVKLPLLAS